MAANALGNMSDQVNYGEVRDFFWSLSGSRPKSASTQALNAEKP